MDHAKTLEKVLKKHNYDTSRLIELLQDIQAEYGYLPQESLVELSRTTKVPFSRIYSTATFFRAFSLKPVGKHVVTVCLGTACHVRGAPLIVEHLKRLLKVEPGETSDDLMYTLQTVNCLGACALGPLVVINGECHGNMTAKKIERIIRDLQKKEAK